MLKHILYVLFSVIVFACSNKEAKVLETQTYRVTMEVQDEKELPFIMKVFSEDSLVINNANEAIKVNEIEYKNDSVYIFMPVFESVLVAKIDENNGLKGYYLKPNLNRKVNFSATEGTERFITVSDPRTNISGAWETVFSPYSENDKYIAKGIFEQNGTKVEGTFRTETGDYRFLEGVIDGDTLKLSTFDGSHAFLFTALVTDTTMVGTFYSGNHWKELFVAKRNETFELADADSLTYLKEGYDKLAFSFPDTEGKLVSLEDERFKNKVVVVQLMGSWCPNCLDESRFFVDYQKQHEDDPIEFIALAFEYAKTKELAMESINRLKKSIGIKYPILLAQYGSSSKIEAHEKLPMLNHVLSYPTAVFIDKSGRVRKIHTGFNGPATKEKYLRFKSEFESYIEELIEE